MADISPVKQADMICDLLLKSPETQNDCLTSSLLKDNRDGTYSFTVRDLITGQEWKHTVLTTEQSNDTTHRHEICTVLAKLFVNDGATKYETYVYEDEIGSPLPEGKKVTITVNYRDVGDE